MAKIRSFFAVLCVVLSTSIMAANDVAELKLAFVYLKQEADKKLSNIDPKPEDLGVAGGNIGINDNNTTGLFVKQKFFLDSFVYKDADKVKKKVDELIKQGYQHIILAVPAELLLSFSDTYADKPVLFYNADAKDDSLRSEQCRKNVLHMVPSYFMFTDALAQFLVVKNWTRWFVVVGTNPNDKKFAAALRKSAKKFGAKIVVEKDWDFGPDTRRTAQKEVPVFTQNIDYDILLVADEIGEFGEYLIYQTWEPKLIAGTQGLMATTWHKTHEKWGSAQLQSRFFKAYKRKMQDLDYQVWMGVRSVGQAATRKNSVDFDKIKDFIFSPDFALAGFKGQKLTMRDWNNQMRQPILLVTANSLVTASPQRRFLHEVTRLDTLGIAEERSQCRFKGG